VILTGRCYCGAVHDAVDGPFAYALNCHCSECRRRTGAAFKPFAGIARDRVRVTQGETALAILGTAENNHTSCARCGTLLFSVVQDGTRVHVTLGTIAGDPGIRPRAHIFVGSKAPWFGITDGLPQLEDFPTG
jgi:hypothetical protein